MSRLKEVRHFDSPFSLTSVGWCCLGSSLLIKILSFVDPFIVGAYTMITPLDEPGPTAIAPPSSSENGGSCNGTPTLACKSPRPVLPIVILALAVAWGAALKLPESGFTVRCPCRFRVGVAVGVAVRVAVAVLVAVAVDVGVEVLLAVDVDVGVTVGV